MLKAIGVIILGFLFIVIVSALDAFNERNKKP